ncbi:MAG: DUF4405 domain-containing protein [Oscillospiraceae bacterium]|jgi:hypothetical protein|nr:DUF4405 domain-containing protein [Oscillospiraceae bacterium]
MIKIKAVLSCLLLLTFVLLACSGALLYFGKTGIVLGMPRYILREAHFWVAGLICVLIILHLLINRRIYLKELKALVKGRKGDAKHKESE